MSGEREWKDRYLESLDEIELKEEAWQKNDALFRECLTTTTAAAWGRSAELDALLRAFRLAVRDGEDIEKLLERARVAKDLVLREDPEESLQDEVNVLAEGYRHLLALLNAVDFPEDVQDRVNTLRLRLEHPRPDDTTSHLVQEMVTLVNALRAELLEEKQEYQGFLTDLSGRMELLQKGLASMLNVHAASSSAGRELQRGVSEELAGMRDRVDQATNLDALKQSVRSSLDTVENLFSKYVSAETARNAQIQEEISGLRSEVTQLRAETSNLARELADEHRRATTDGLTGLTNRAALDAGISKLLALWERHGRPLSVVMVDIDHFKSINDNFGHKTGDRVLQELAKRMTQVGRTSDILARYGGEEFVMVLPETDLEQAEKAAEKLRVLVERLRFHYEQKPVPVTLSAGVAQARKGEDAGSLIERADKTLYRAKHAGRNRVLTASG